ncbi:MAG TPA: hypothetical protein VK737_06665 [Opitutales bacterium]|jgi:hypothetical protein|nr:hypothetical protein [Opitutales bacterium]
MNAEKPPAEDQTSSALTILRADHPLFRKSSAVLDAIRSMGMSLIIAFIAVDYLSGGQAVADGDPPTAADASKIMALLLGMNLGIELFTIVLGRKITGINANSLRNKISRYCGLALVIPFVYIAAQQPAGPDQLSKVYVCLIVAAAVVVALLSWLFSNRPMENPDQSSIPSEPRRELR